MIIAQWWHSLSATAEAVTLLPNTSPHLPTGTLVVTMVDRYLAPTGPAHEEIMAMRREVAMIF